ncbi:alpha/beta hydrolase [Tsukamurella ocularis]|uniref:alpha/beta hydrolase n=1 Tax=Tsukamurella ocularis TaxID=1970234 RepID=UPI002167E325|nr:alpha/beta hydrolase family protein [Tsukamurella ocularis]MCS3781537.1 diacylglycerol O-acyltransferase/trehalose O-mycolyltransferase [Tsukamurella ocularis]MCS3787909.1 diacylglycerol O-acyltransferase/trehalose O-mycolyltransferase [Tsukamurella ocularis]MCS3851204.1 diacylglycerol O-acyltransferase/trehalose O-mycolyltransferase [Tsukamurella ocularis]
MRMRNGWAKKATAAAVTVAAIPALTIAGTGAANAWGPGSAKNPPKGFKQAFVNGAGMPNVKVRSWASTTTDPKKAPTVVLLDGLRATWDVSGWERDSNVAFLSQKGINVVTPVGGTSSWYTDWQGPSSTNRQAYRYTWASFLKNSLPQYIRSLGFSDNVSLVGLSMSGSAAIINTLESNGYYKRAASLSGLNNISAPGVPIAVGIASLDSGGYNAGLDMWGGPFDSRWAKNDPTVQVNRLKNIPLWISAGNGVFGKYTPNPGPADVIQGVPLEWLALSQSRSFQGAAQRAGLNKVHYDFPAAGTHTWGYWQDQVWQMQRTGWFSK